MRSFIPWIGGKSALSKTITDIFPDNVGRYIEVFGGGGSILFASDHHAALEVYNDANSDLVCLFRCIKYHPDELSKEIQYYLNSREVFNDCRRKLESNGDYTDIQRAAMFYICIKISYGAKMTSFGCIKKRLSSDRFSEVSQRLNGVVIENKDFEDLIRQYDRTDALFYCDPPYHTTEKLYSAVFKEDDHYRLKSVLSGLKGRFILSYNDDDFVRDLYSDFKIRSLERQNNLSSGTFKELLITNF